MRIAVGEIEEQYIMGLENALAAFPTIDRQIFGRRSLAKELYIDYVDTDS